MPNGLQRRESHDQRDRGAVRIGDDLPFPRTVPLLQRHQLQVIGIDFRHQQRHVAIHAVILRIRHDDVPGLRERALDLRRHRGIHRREQQPRRIVGLALLHDQVGLSSGITPCRCHLVASRYFLPAERSLAPSHLTSNHGWPCRNLMKCWPTMPVAPKMPTSILASITVSPCVDRFRLLRRVAAWARALRACAPREWCPARSETAGPMRRRKPECRWCKPPPWFQNHPDGPAVPPEFRALHALRHSPFTAFAMASRVAARIAHQPNHDLRRASSAMIFGARPPLSVPIFSVLGPSSSSTGNSMCRMPVERVQQFVDGRFAQLRIRRVRHAAFGRRSRSATRPWNPGPACFPWARR